jgi:curli biogenesis system outer membrane secretion channel CsgG
MRRALIVAAACAALAGCATATVDKQSVRATSGQPESLQVDVVRIPYDPSLPTYVVAVEPLQIAVDGSGGGAGAPPVPGRHYGWGPWGYGLLPEGPQAEAYNPPPAGMSDRVGHGVSAQLISALGNVGNVQVVDYDYFVANRGKPSVLVKKGEVGPLLIKGNITEFNEVAEAQGSARGGGLGVLGAGLAIGGAIAGNTPATIAGSSLALANPSYNNTRMRRTGSVGMDLQMMDPRNGRIVGTAVCAGKFTSEAATSGFSVFGIGGADTAYAASALGQAQRAAMNDAVQQISQRLRSVR